MTGSEINAECRSMVRKCLTKTSGVTASELFEIRYGLDPREEGNRRDVNRINEALCQLVKERVAVVFQGRFYLAN